MVRDHRFPAGPRPAEAPTRYSARFTHENTAPNSHSTPTPTPSNSNGPMLSASSSNNHSLFSFGRDGSAPDVGDNTAASLDFLPSVSFDDLQSSLESASTDFKLTQFPSPTGQGAILGGDTHFLHNMAGQQPNVTQSGGTTRVAIQPNPANAGPARTTRSGSTMRPVASRRQPSNGSLSSASAGVPEAPTAPPALRNRRQHPPVSNSTATKPPRRSVGPGGTEPDQGNRGAIKRRPSLLTATSEKDVTVRNSMDMFGSGENSNGTADDSVLSSRTTKMKTAHASRLSANFSPASNNAALTPEGNRKSLLFPRSPKTGGTTSGSNSGKRASIAPGHPAHVTGLGARTISPTDAQRMRRMSMHQTQSVSPLAQLANEPPPPIDTRPHSRSPSMIPRKTSTPSSSRTTPEANRKSYSSGLSLNSTTSLNTHRTSTGSAPRAIGQSASTSRLPAPKAVAHNNNNTPPAEEDEDVPPVPAIPKVYESPKDASGEISFVSRTKSTNTFDDRSIKSSSTGTVSNAPSLEPAAKVQRKSSFRKQPLKKAPTFGTFGGISSDVERRQNTTSPSRKTLPPLRLPPLNLGPLNTPTTQKIAALKDPGDNDGRRTPPNRSIPKTPTTPMTASKSSFFSRGRAGRDPEKPLQRSNTAIQHSRRSSPDITSSSESLTGVPIINQPRKPTVSPFLSSSVPKNEHGFDAGFSRSKTSGEINKNTTHEMPVDAKPQQKPTGPRAQKLAKLEKSTPVESSPEEPPTPSSMSSLRRKLSLSLKRSKSKSSNHQPSASGDQTSGNGRQESMPPPRLPASATVGSIKDPSSSVAAKPSTGSYLESRRRKSSTSSLNAVMSQGKNPGDSWNGPKKSVDVGNSSMIETSSSTRAASGVQRILRPRPSTTTVKQNDGPYTADLDKDDLVAEDEMKRLASRRKETELAARTLDALRKRASPKERVGPQEAIRIAMLNIYERGEIVDYSDIFFCGTQNAAKVLGNLHSSAPNFGYDDDRGDYTIIAGDHLAYRYEIVDVLGKGSFGQVVRCIDHKTGVLVAVKIIRNKKRFHQQALVEVNILQKLRDWDPKNKHSMVNFTHSFYFRGHLCISTELLDMNLYEFIKSNSFRGFSLKLIRRFTKQMLSSLNLLKQHKVIHCDLKPENILLRHPMHSEIKTIDFGSSCFENQKVYTYIQSRFYRSPEVILGMTYGLPIDMWSLGCILAELYTGVPIFPGENEQEQLACIMEVFGPPEKHLIEKSTRKKLFFDSLGKPRLTVSSKGRRRRPSSKTLQQALKCDDEAFVDFVAKCLKWDPDRRIKPEEAIRHQFVTGQKTSMPTPRAGAPRDASPMKRNNTIAHPRPLPDPPGSTPKIGTSLRPREATGASPSKAAPTRRASAVTGSFMSGPKRTSTTANNAPNTSGLGGSNLPRVAGRAVSGKPDLASAGANVAMSRRA